MWLLPASLQLNLLRFASQATDILCCLCFLLRLQEPFSSSACFAGLLDKGHKAKQQLAQVPLAAHQQQCPLTYNSQYRSQLFTLRLDVASTAASPP
jgi:hypothetical protein